MHPEASGPDADEMLDTAALALATGRTKLLRNVLATMPFGVGLLDQRLHWLFLNPAFTVATGVQGAELLGRSAEEPPYAADPEVLRQVLAGGEAREAVAGPGRGVRARYQRLDPAEDQAAVLVTVVETAEQRSDRRRDLEQAMARLTLLGEAAGRIGTTLDVDTTCTELAEFAILGLADLATVDILPTTAEESERPTGTPRLRRAARACTATLRQQLDACEQSGETIRYQEGSTIALCLETGKPALANLLSDEQLDSAADPGSCSAYHAAGVDSLLAVPLTARGGHLIGVLTLARRRGTSLGFTDEDLVLVEDLAGRAAISIDNARRYARSQGITLELQRALLAEPGKPHPNLEMASRYLPSGTTSMVGGDWYETVRLSFGRTLLVIGDVMGHGVEAAVDMSNYRSMLRYVAASDLPPHRILAQLDALISADDTARPATCMLALVDPARDRWTFSSAGHLPPALLSAAGDIELIDVPTGPPLGTGFGGYEHTTVRLRPDQVLLLYTDGLVERRGEDIDESLARLAGLRLPATGDLSRLLDAVLHGLTPQAAEDDIALLAARVTPRG